MSDLPRSLRKALDGCVAAQMSGVLRVTGEPGGTIHLMDGGITAIDTPGAPSSEVILLRSQRVPEPGWAAAFAAAASEPGRRMGDELVVRNLIGPGELESLLRTALADAMFVLCRGRVEDCEAEAGADDCLLPVEPAAEADWLLAEAAWRMQVLASLPNPIAPDRDRVTPAPGAVAPGARLGEGRDEILALANGRRTPRDLAFALGRGVYATTLQLAAMQNAGLLVTASHGAAPPAGTTGDRGQVRKGEAPEGEARNDDARKDDARKDDARTAAGLPRRHKSLPEQARRTEQPRRAGEPDEDADPLTLPRPLRPRSGGD